MTTATEALDACTEPELDMLRKLYYYPAYINELPFWDYLMKRQEILTRERLCTEYEITLDDFGRYATMPETQAYRLMMAQLKCAADAILMEATSEYGVSDDGLDYLTAATDQASWVSETLANYDRVADVLKVLNMTKDDVDINETAMCFQYGYADHGGPMSELAHMNDEE